MPKSIDLRTVPTAEIIAELRRREKPPRRAPRAPRRRRGQAHRFGTLAIPARCSIVEWRLGGGEVSGPT